MRINGKKFVKRRDFLSTKFDIVGNGLPIDKMCKRVTGNMIKNSAFVYLI